MGDLGLCVILPLDHNIYIHKFIGTIIFVQAWWHTIMHLINFGVNVQPDPIKFVENNKDYWDDPTKLGYNQWRNSNCTDKLTNASCRDTTITELTLHCQS